MKSERFILSAMLLAWILSACSQEPFPLPTYGHSYLVYQSLPTPLARLGGALEIIDGCVGIGYDKKNNQFRYIPIFKGGTQLTDNGKILKAGRYTFHHGDYVGMSGMPTDRHFERNLPFYMPYTPIPEHCHAQEYWSVGSITPEKPKKNGGNK